MMAPCSLHVELAPSMLGVTSLQVLEHLPPLLFVFFLGACAGSFLNVLCGRMTIRMSVVNPPSRCPTCGVRLRFFSENLPILGWFLVRGHCRSCRAPVPIRYMIVELCTALVFAGMYGLLYSRGSGWWTEIADPWWSVYGLRTTWPMFILYAGLLLSLAAMTAIDARTFTIPLSIPLLLTCAACVLCPLQAWIEPGRAGGTTWPLPGTGWPVALAAAGGMVGVLWSTWRVRSGRTTPSFADYYEYVADGETLGAYPHARREMKKELLFLLPVIGGCVTGFVLATMSGYAGSVPPPAVQALAGALTGYLVGGACVWCTRIAGTLAFGKEAMGMGDVHLLASVGAVLGWFDPVLIFFLAPFSGLTWALLSSGCSRALRTRYRELPYGPHLALATLVLLLARPVISNAWTSYFPPAFAMPQDGFFQE